MKTKPAIILLLILLISSIVINVLTLSQNAALQEELTSMINKVDELENGDSRLLALINLQYTNQNYEEVKNIYNLFYAKHFDSPLLPEITSVYNSVIAAEEAERIAKEKEAQEQEQKRLQAVNKLYKNHDDVRNITFYEQKYYTHYNNNVRVGLIFSTCAVESNSKTKNLQESCIFLHDPFFSHIVG